MSFAKYIRREREKLNVHRPEFAKMLGLSVRTLESWEYGYRKPRKLTEKMVRIIINGEDGTIDKQK